jgi:hypothetical protein
MLYTSLTRPVESEYLDSITSLKFTADGETLMQPDGRWDIAILKRDDHVEVLRTGLTTRTVTYEHAAGDETLVISFKPSVFMPLMPGEVMRDEGVVLEKFGRAGFWIGTDVREIPTLENADVFVEHLIRSGIIERNDLVDSVLAGSPRATTERTLQRHFLKTTGLTYKTFTLIERAQKAASLLRLGQSASDVAFALGYSDQAHMINSLRTILSQTPGQIAREAAPPA